MEAKVFVKINKYRNVLDSVSNIKNKLNEAKDILSQVTELKRKEDEELSTWNAKIAEVEEKVEKINNELVEPEAI